MCMYKVQKGLEIRGFWFQKKTIQHKTALREVTPKVWGLENNTNLNSIFCLVKSSEMVLIFLPAFYLIIWVLTHQRILKKYPFLKI